MDGDVEFEVATLWIVAVGFVVSFVLAFGIGANDVANSFGTSVGSGVLNLKTACVLATVFEISGSVLLGYKVSDTIRKGIIDVHQYEDRPEEYMLGNLSALAGSATWLILATFLKMPISGTHSIVGAVLGFSLVARGFSGIDWFTLGKIVGSWFISPVLSGLVSGSIFILIKKFILSQSNPIDPGLRSLPIFYGLTVLINVVSILLGGPDYFKLKIEGLPEWSEHAFGVIISIVIGLMVATVVHCYIVPKMRRKITGELLNSGPKDPVKFTFDNGNDTAESSNTQSPVDGSLEDLGQLEKDKINHNILKMDHQNGNMKSENKYVALKSNGYGDQNGDFKSKEGKDKKMLEVEAIPMEGLSPSGSAVPLIKSASTTSSTPMVIDMDIVMGNGNAKNVDNLDSNDEGDSPAVSSLFSFLQILTAAFGSFAHGGNDVSNAIGPLIALWLVYQEGAVHQKASTPLFLLVYGGIGISLGLWIWGRRVIQTMGEDLTKITPSSGFTIEIGAAITVLVASKIGLPVSTTHCKVGSVVFVGWLRTEKGGVDWKLFRNIIYAWVVTVPVTGGLTALIMYVLSSIAL